MKCTSQYLQAEATLVSVSYTRECSTMMVTVCPPPSYGYQDPYHHGHKCKVRQGMTLNKCVMK